MSDAAMLLIGRETTSSARSAAGRGPDATLQRLDRRAGPCRSRHWRARGERDAAGHGQAGITEHGVIPSARRSLVEIGALIRIAPGRYALNPRAGSLASREQAAQKPGPHLVEPA